MRRRTFDLLASGAGLLIAVVLIVAGALMTWGYTFVNNQVTTQLTEQQIVFPAKGSPELTALPPADEAAMSQYAGQQMTNGAQAETYANNFIAVHLKEIGGGKTYSQLSAESLAQPGNLKLAAQVDTVFRGTTLRGLLLNAYAFWQIGQILLIAFIIAYIAGAIMLVLAALGLWHSRRTPERAELFGRPGAHIADQPSR
ncbi:MAG: hypothetical protein JO132_13670 [Streptosporangiaceae bacterium]|nr:hypothetical protein [Streptosporangiaceae bacterium]